MHINEWWQQARPRERDMLIGEKIFGWRRDEYVCGPNDYHAEGVKLERWYDGNDLLACRGYAPDGEIISKDSPAGIDTLLPRGHIYFTAHMSAAWVVVAKLREDGLHLRLNDTLSQYRAQFFTVQDSQAIKDDGRYYEFSESPECAICLGALRVKGVTQVDMPIIGGGE